MLGEFKPSTPYTMGVELELQLISLDSYDLTQASPEVLKCLDNTSLPETNYTPEMTQSMLEIKTDIHDSYQELLDKLKDIREVLLKTCSGVGIAICGGGAHPFQCWTDQKIYDKKRYQELYLRYGYLAKRFTVFGQHVHIGCRNGNEALYLLHALSRYLPQFIALAASSPFIRGIDTFFDSARLNSVFAFPLSGHAPFILDWQQFDDQYFTKIQATGIIKSMKDFYWDIRPKPEYGTIELRVCDTPLTIGKAATIAAYLQVLCKYLLEEKAYIPNEEDYLVYNYNRFQACRFGLDGEIVHPQTYQKLVLREDILATMDKLAPHAIELNALGAFQNLLKYISDDNDANFLREVSSLNDNNTYKIVQASIKRFKNKL